MSGRTDKPASLGVSVRIECKNCHKQRTVELSRDKFRKLSESWVIQEACVACAATTDWTFAQATIDETEQEDFWDWMAASAEYFQPESGAQQDERRKEPRVDVRLALHISSAEGDEDVTSTNISKSGFCFSSPRTYQVGQSIQATLTLPGTRDPIIKSGTVVRAGTGANGQPAYGVRLE